MYYMVNILLMLSNTRSGHPAKCMYSSSAQLIAVYTLQHSTGGNDEPHHQHHLLRPCQVFCRIDDCDRARAREPMHSVRVARLSWSGCVASPARSGRAKWSEGANCVCCDATVANCCCCLVLEEEKCDVVRFIERQFSSNNMDEIDQAVNL